MLSSSSLCALVMAAEQQPPYVCLTFAGDRVIGIRYRAGWMSQRDLFAAACHLVYLWHDMDSLAACRHSVGFLTTALRPEMQAEASVKVRAGL